MYFGFDYITFYLFLINLVSMFIVFIYILFPTIKKVGLLYKSLKSIQHCRRIYFIQFDTLVRGCIIFFFS